MWRLVGIWRCLIASTVCYGLRAMNVVGLFVLYTANMFSSDLLTMMTTGMRPPIEVLCCSCPNPKDCSACPDSRFHDRCRPLSGSFKSVAAKEIHGLAHGLGLRVWQARFHEQVVRNRSDLGHIGRYVRNNPGMCTGG